jgi:hypothetical protein
MFHSQYFSFFLEKCRCWALPVIFALTWDLCHVVRVTAIRYSPCIRGNRKARKEGGGKGLRFEFQSVLSHNIRR